MAATHRFTKNVDDTQVSLVIDHIESIERDEFSDCTSIKMTSGETFGVKESVEEVEQVLNANRT